MVKNLTNCAYNKPRQDYRVAQTFYNGFTTKNRPVKTGRFSLHSFIFQSGCKAAPNMSLGLVKIQNLLDLQVKRPVYVFQTL